MRMSKETLLDVVFWGLRLLLFCGPAILEVVGVSRLGRWMVKAIEGYMRIAFYGPGLEVACITTTYIS